MTKDQLTSKTANHNNRTRGLFRQALSGIILILLFASSSASPLSPYRSTRGSYISSLGPHENGGPNHSEASSHPNLGTNFYKVPRGKDNDSSKPRSEHEKKIIQVEFPLQNDGGNRRIQENQYFNYLNQSMMTSSSQSLINSNRSLYDLNQILNISNKSLTSLNQSLDNSNQFLNNLNKFLTNSNQSFASSYQSLINSNQSLTKSIESNQETDFDIFSALEALHFKYHYSIDSLFGQQETLGEDKHEIYSPMNQNVELVDQQNFNSPSNQQIGVVNEQTHYNSIDQQDDLLENEDIYSPNKNIDVDYIYDGDFDEELKLPLTDDERKRVQLFDPETFNYTAFRLQLDQDLQTLNKRQSRFLDTSIYRLPRFLSNIGKMLDIETVINEIETSIMTSVSCNACKGGVGLLQHYIDQGKTKEDIVRAASKLCTNFRVETPRVCFGILHLMVDEVVYVMTNLVMEPDGICGFLIGDVCGGPHDPYHKWRVLFPPYPKPPIELIKPPKEDMPTLKVLHLSDTHFDPYYLEGSNAECNEPMCCRQTSGKPANQAARAGKWGDYRKCDTPERTIRSMFQNIAQEHPDIDYILWTGDLPPHDIWNQTKDSNLKVLLDTVQQLFDYFPNTPVFPALGNHESAPVNSFPPPSIPAEHSVQWLYNELDRQWRRWLPEYTSPTILKGGYYAVQVLPGFRIISLNMNYCNNKNWWLLLDSEDPADQLQWLVYELQSSELKDEKVHIIGHIPPGYQDCLRVWSHNFYTIVNRFEHTITAQFYGHTHFDEFELFYDPYRRYRVTNVAYIAPSQTSYYKLNPGYRLYSLQGHFTDSDKRVIDHETWVMDLDIANAPDNALKEPTWYPLYSARRAYGMRSLLPVDWDNLVYRMVGDDTLFNTFYRHYWKNSPKREACDSECKKRILCDLKSGRSNDRKKTCAEVLERVEAQERSQWRSWLFSGFTVTYGWIMGIFGYD